MWNTFQKTRVAFTLHNLKNEFIFYKAEQQSPVIIVSYVVYNIY